MMANHLSTGPIIMNISIGEHIEMHTMIKCIYIYL